MLLHPGDIILSTRKNAFSALIRWWTMSAWSHVRIAIGPSLFIEATWPHARLGTTAEIPAGALVLRPTVPLSDGDIDALIERATAIVDAKPRFDWLGLISFLLRRNVGRKSWFFCSEMVAEIYAGLGRPVLRKPPNWTTPQDLYQSLEFTEVGTWHR
jgi:hypothetical protein